MILIKINNFLVKYIYFFDKMRKRRKYRKIEPNCQTVNPLESQKIH